jgi:hypothetical protein
MVLGLGLNFNAKKQKTKTKYLTQLQKNIEKDNGK